MKSFTKYILALIAGLTIVSLNAQEKSAARIVRTSEADKAILDNSKPNGYDKIQAPRFILKDQDGKFILAIGGYIKPIVGWDIGNTLDGTMYFTPSSIPVPAKTGSKGEMFINPLHSSLDLQVIGLPGTKNEIVGYVSVKFNGGGTDGALFKLNSAIIKYRGFTVGYNYSVFTDVMSLPMTISCSGVTGNDWSKAYQISYNSPSYGGFSWGLGMELPSFNEYTGKYEGSDYPQFDDYQFYGKATQSIPDIPFYVQYGWKGHSHIRFSGLVRNFKYVNLLEDKSNIVTGMGGQFSTAIRIVKPLTIMGQLTYGKGIGHYINGLQYEPYSYIPDNDYPGKMKANEMRGWFGGIKIGCSENVDLNFTYGQTRIFNSATYNTGYRYGQDFRPSVFWRITPYLQTEIEYLYGRRHNLNGDKASDNRIQTMIMFS